MAETTVEIVTSSTVAGELDELLWRNLWKPLGFPRDVRRRFAVDGEQLDLAARENGRVVGGLVAVWAGEGEVEIRHLAVKPAARDRGTGKRLVGYVIETARDRECRRVHTIARSTTSGFFRRLGFVTPPGTAPEHPDFAMHGIHFELLELAIQPAGQAGS